MWFIPDTGEVFVDFSFDDFFLFVGKLVIITDAHRDHPGHFCSATRCSRRKHGVATSRVKAVSTLSRFDFFFLEDKTAAGFLQ